MPTCVRFCTLPTDDLRVEYRCLSFPGTLERSWDCESLVSSRTLVKPICRFPGYFSRELPGMHCRDGMWDYNLICHPGLKNSSTIVNNIIITSSNVNILIKHRAV